MRKKRFASSVIPLLAALPKAREEVRVVAKQMLRAGPSVAAQVREFSRARSNAEYVSNWVVQFKRQTRPSHGTNFSVKMVESNQN